MAVIEQTIFNQVAYEAFTPKVTQENNSNLIRVLVITGIAAIIAGIVIHELRELEKRNMKRSQG